MENERLVFPLTRLPLVLLEDADQSDSFFSALLKNRLMWLGFALPLLLHSWNSLGNYNDLFQKVALSGSFSMLGGMVGVPYRLNLPIIGLGYLMPLSISFSVWLFFLLGVVQRAIFTRIGLQIGTSDI